VRVYLDTGIFIDYLSVRSGIGTVLRSSPRRGRSPSQLNADAETLLNSIGKKHEGATSVLTYYEAEEALYRELSASTKGISNAQAIIIPSARSLPLQVHTAARLFNISVLDMTAVTIKAQLSNFDLQTHGTRAADAIHIVTAMEFDSDIIVSGDSGILALDRILMNKRANAVICCDSDVALTLL
jgi:hypothetical protein